MSSCNSFFFPQKGKMFSSKLPLLVRKTISNPQASSEEMVLSQEIMPQISESLVSEALDNK